MDGGQGKIKMMGKIKLVPTLSSFLTHLNLVITILLEHFKVFTIESMNILGRVDGSKTFFFMILPKANISLFLVSKIGILVSIFLSLYMLSCKIRFSIYTLLQLQYYEAKTFLKSNYGVGII